MKIKQDITSLSIFHGKKFSDPTQYTVPTIF